jgi:scyllo-inositol 2-dehydrogenase (NAD+)
MNALINIGLAGFGRMGQEHAHMIATRVPGAQLFAVAEPDAQLRALAASRHNPQHVTQHLADMLALPGLDAVLVATPTATHTPAIVAAAEAGKPVFTEKPLALTLADCRTAVDAAKRARVPLQVGFMRRFDAAYAEARKRIAAGEIGDPLMFKGVGRDNGCPRPHFADPARSGGLIFDMAIHDLDLARWWMGAEVSRVSAMGGLLHCHDLAPVGDIDNAVINLRFDNGALGNVDTSRNAFYGYDIRHEIMGSHGTIMVGMHQHSTVILQKTRDGFNPLDIPDRFGRAYVAQLAHFVDCVRTGATPAVNGDDGLAASAISIAATKAQREDRTVALTEVL